MTDDPPVPGDGGDMTMRDFTAAEIDEAFDLLDTVHRQDVWATHPYGPALLLANMARGLIDEARADPEKWIAERRAKIQAANAAGPVPKRSRWRVL